MEEDARPHLCKQTELMEERLYSFRFPDNRLPFRSSQILVILVETILPERVNKVFLENDSLIVHCDIPEARQIFHPVAANSSQLDRCESCCR